jgi:hypothetical protein
MNESTPGVSTILDPPPPADPASASARMETLKADPAFMKRVEGKDAEAFSEFNRLWRISRGLTPDQQVPVNTVDVLTQHGERAVAAAEQHLGVYLEKGFSDEAAYQIVNRRPMLLEEKQTRERELGRLQKDEAFMARYRAGDRDARLEYDSHVIARSLPSGTLADIHRWEAAHNRPLSK